MNINVFTKRICSCKNVFFLLFVLSLSACSTMDVISFQVLRPGQVNIPPDVKTLSFVNRNTHFVNDTLSGYYMFNDEIRKDSIPLDTVVPKTCFYGFIDNISEYLTQDSIPYVQLDSLTKKDSINTYLPISVSAVNSVYKHFIQGDISVFQGDSILKQESINTFEPLSWSIVDSICAANGSDVIVVLEGVRVNNKYSIDGNLYDGFYGFNDVNYWAVWRIYDPLYQQYHDEFLQMDSLYFEEYSNSYNDVINNKLPDRKSVLQDAGYLMGQEYAKRIAPYWNETQRKYYCYGNRQLEVACYHIKQNNLDEAILLLKASAKDKKYKIAARAAFNLALVYELKGNLEEADEWIKRSISFYEQTKVVSENEFEHAEEYSIIIDERRRELERLKAFFGE